MGRIAFTAMLVVVFAVKAVRWWLDVSSGAVAVDAVTTVGWVRVDFYYLAVVVGVAAIGGMVRARTRDPASEPGAATVRES